MEFTFNTWGRIKESWFLYKKNFLTLALLLAIPALVQLVLNNTLNQSSQLMSLIIIIIELIIMISVYYISLKIILNLVNNKEIKPFSEKIAPTFSKIWRFFITSFIVSIIAFIGFILLIVPGIYLITRLFFAPYISINENKKVFESIRKSWDMTSGRFGDIFGNGLILFLFSAFLMFVVMIVLSILIALFLSIVSQNYLSSILGFFTYFPYLISLLIIFIYPFIFFIISVFYREYDKFYVSIGNEKIEEIKSE